MANKTTLIVLQHGLWGTASHMDYLEKQILEKLDSKSIATLNVECNQDKFTYDGVDICGKRLAHNIQDHVKYLANEENKIVTKFIIIGYSLGGLIARYAIGLLGKNGFFNTIEPLLFVTFATPHLGVKRESKSNFAKIYNFLTAHMLSRTGEQLQLLDSFGNDDRPLLNILADSNREFYHYLAKFKSRRIYANITNDRTVPYWTAAMDTFDYFEDMENIELSLDKEYSSVVTAFDLRHPVKQQQQRRRKRNHTTLAIRITILLLSPILLPIAFTYIGTQGLISRFRVRKILTKLSSSSSSSSKEQEDMEKIKDCDITGGSSDEDDDNTLLHHKHSQKQQEQERHHHHKEDPVLMDTLDAMDTIPNETSTDKSPQITQQKTKNRLSLYNIKPSKALQQKYSSMQLTKEQFEIEKNMHQLEWERVMIYIDGFNAHGSIVCRTNRFANRDGKAAIRHFVDSLLLD